MRRILRVSGDAAKTPGGPALVPARLARRDGANSHHWQGAMQGDATIIGTFVLHVSGDPMRIPFLSRHHHRHRSRGQSLVELALILPVILLIVMFAVDFGRAFYSWVTITNATRVGANYAAANPNDAYPNAPYTALVQAEALNAICPITGTFNPTFLDGSDAGTATKNLGDSARVAVSCNFRVLTPVIGSILSNTVQISASSAFPIRTGAQQ